MAEEVDTDYVDVLVEIPFGSNMKYEFDKKAGMLRCDRLLHTPHAYPFNYGYIPNTLAGDGDDLDAVIVNKYRIEAPSLIRCRIIGALLTVDEKGKDEKVICVPHESVDPEFRDIHSLDDLTSSQRDKIEYLFMHYKRMEPNKFVEVQGFVGAKEARKLYYEALARRIANTSTGTGTGTETD